MARRPRGSVSRAAAVRRFPRPSRKPAVQSRSSDGVERRRVFADELRRRDGPALLGTTFHCMDLSEHDARSAHVQSMVLAANASTLQKFRTYFFDGCPEDKADAIYGGELPLSRAILEEGLELGALALAHGRSPRLRLKPGARLAATCSAIRDATELNLGDTYFPAPGLSAPDVSPLEVVFFKTARSGAHRARAEREQKDAPRGGALKKSARRVKRVFPDRLGDRFGERRRSRAGGALDRLARWAYFHAGLGEDAIDADYALPALRGEGPCAEAHWPVAQKDADARAADRKAELEGALREANAALSEAGAEVARLKRALAGAVYL